MAPTFPSCIRSTFCSHRQASWFLLATLSPLFLPFLILCVPFLLLFLAPISVFLFSLLLLYKVRVYLRRKLKGSHKTAEKSVLDQGYQPSQQIAAADQRLAVRKQAPLDEDRESKGLGVSNVQSAELHTYNEEGEREGLCIPPSRKEEKLGHSEEELTSQIGITEEELFRNDRIEDCKQECEERIEFIDERRHSPQYADAPLLCTSSEENRPLTHEGESLDVPYGYDNRNNMPVEWQGEKTPEDRYERSESPHREHLEEVCGELPASQVPELTVDVETSAYPEQIVEKPWDEELTKQCEIDTTTTPVTDVVTHEHNGEEPELSSEKDSGLEILHNKGKLDKKEDIVFPTEPFETEGEQCYSSTEGHGTEEGYPSEASSSAIPPSHVSRWGIEYEDRVHLEQKIMADINAIKKIVGYQGDPHTSLLEHISGLYMFLGMEPNSWAAEVDNLERAQAEIELLKVVVGVK